MYSLQVLSASYNPRLTDCPRNPCYVSVSASLLQ